MRNYLILREKVRAFRADPEVQQATEESRVLELWESTLAPGRPWQTSGRPLRPRRTREAGMHFERLDQLALEYLYGVR